MTPKAYEQAVQTPAPNAWCRTLRSSVCTRPMPSELAPQSRAASIACSPQAVQPHKVRRWSLKNGMKGVAGMREAQKPTFLGAMLHEAPARRHGPKKNLRDVPRQKRSPHGSAQASNAPAEVRRASSCMHGGAPCPPRRVAQDGCEASCQAARVYALLPSALFVALHGQGSRTAPAAA
jgi:hypothetical protein